MNPADVTQVCIRYRLGTPSSASRCPPLCTSCSSSTRNGVLYPARTAGVEKNFRRLTDTWAANPPCLASLGELGWEGCAHEEILLSSCWLSPLAPAAPAAPP